MPDRMISILQGAPSSSATAAATYGRRRTNRSACSTATCDTCRGGSCGSTGASSTCCPPRRSSTTRRSFFLVEPTGTIYRNPAMSLIRRREVADGMREHLELHNHGMRAGRARDDAAVRRRLRRPVRGQGRAGQARQALPARATATADARLPARRLPPGDVHPRRRRVPHRRVADLPARPGAAARSGRA